MRRPGPHEREKLGSRMTDLPARPRAGRRRRRGGRRQARRRHPRLRRQRPARHHRRLRAVLGLQRPPGPGDRRRRSRSGCATLGAKPVRREGEREGRWVLLDYIDIIVHVQHAEERVYYSLERIWKDCPTVELPEEVRRGRCPGRRGDRRDGRRCRGSVLSAAAGRPAVVLWRHGQTAGTWRAASRAARTSSSTRSGAAQAGRAGAAARLAGAGRRSSPPTCARAGATAEVAGRARAALDVPLDARLRETYGGSLAGPHRRRDAEPDADDYAAWRSGADVPAGGGERRTDGGRPASAPAILDALAARAGRERPSSWSPTAAGPRRDRHPARPAAGPLGGPRRAGQLLLVGARGGRRRRGGWSSTTPAACPSR